MSRPAQTTTPNAATARHAITITAPDKLRVLNPALLDVLVAEEEDAEEVPVGLADPDADEEPEADVEAKAEAEAEDEDAVELDWVREV